MTADANMEPRNRVVLRVPATTANLGPGFDTIGMALDIWNEYVVERSDSMSLEIEGEGAEQLPRDKENLVIVGARAAFEAAGESMPPLKFICRQRIPFARGLGSSSAALVAGILAGLVLAGRRLPVEGKEELLQIAANLEGHPDNVAPAIYGGIQLGVRCRKIQSSQGEDNTRDNLSEECASRWYTSRVQCPDGLQCVVFIPDSTALTKDAVAALPKEISVKDAVHNVGRAAMLVNALNRGHLEELWLGMEDRIHQPYRGAATGMFPHLYPLINAARAAGAHGAFLSGAGPSVMAVTSGRRGDIFAQLETERKEMAVAEAMKKAAAEHGVAGRVFVSSPSDKGAHIVCADPPFNSQSILQFTAP